MRIKDAKRYIDLELATTRHALGLSDFIGKSACEVARRFGTEPIRHSQQKGFCWKVPPSALLEKSQEGLAVVSLGYLAPCEEKQTRNRDVGVVRLRSAQQDIPPVCRFPEGVVGSFWKLTRIHSPEKTEGSGVIEAHVTRLLAAQAVAEAVAQVVETVPAEPSLPALAIPEAEAAHALLEDWAQVDETAVLLSTVRAVRQGFPSALLQAD